MSSPIINPSSTTLPYRHAAQDEGPPAAERADRLPPGIQIPQGEEDRLLSRIRGIDFDANVIGYVENPHPMALEPGPRPSPRGDEAGWAPRGVRPTEAV